MISEFVVVGAPVSVDLNHKSRRNVVGVEINPYIFDNVYGLENYFEFKVDGMIIKMDEVDLRDLKIRKILENDE